MSVMAQITMVMNLDKCIGCHTCCDLQAGAAEQARQGIRVVQQRRTRCRSRRRVRRPPRGLAIAKESDNRFTESHFAVGLSRLAATHGDPLDAFEFLTVAIRNFYDSGSFSIMAGPFAILAAFFDRLGHYEAAATISGFATSPLARTAFPETNTTITHLREVLGDKAPTNPPPVPGRP
jgi:hypothetical protein